MVATSSLIFPMVLLKLRARSPISSFELIAMVWVRSPSPSAMSFSFSDTVTIGLVVVLKTKYRIAAAATTAITAAIIVKMVMRFTSAIMTDSRIMIITDQVTSELPMGKDCSRTYTLSLTVPPAKPWYSKFSPLTTAW